MGQDSIESHNSEMTSEKQSGSRMKKWAARVGFWGVVFFVVKGLLWLTIPALIALFVD